MADYSNGTSLDRSPFDLPRNFFYDNITDYHLKKAEQLFQVKNFELVINELKGLLDCAVRNDENILAREIEEKLLKAERFLSQRTESRQKLKCYFDKFLKDSVNNDAGKNGTGKLPSGPLLKSINIFNMEAGLTEEYSNLIAKIFTYYSKNLNDLSFNSVKDTLEQVLTFDPLKLLLAVGKIELEKGLSPFLMFDLDSTLFDNSPRVLKIIQDFIKEHSDFYPEDIKKLSKLKREDIIWGIKENLNKLGIINENMVNHVINYWYKRFFSNEYIIDLPLRGGQQFVQDAETLGIKIIYLTGRFESMREGTVKNILEHGFPIDNNCSNLLLKPDEKIPDHIFKHESMEKVKKMGNLLAGFDNEPLNSNIFLEHFPESEVFFLETNHSINPPNLLDKVHTIPDFSYLN